MILKRLLNVEKLKIYFLGSGDIAVPVLRACLDSEQLEVVGIGTQPDRAAGRRGRMMPTPVGAFAAAAGLTVDKPESVNRPDFLAQLRSRNLDVVLVVSFGQLLRQEMLALPRLGCVNVHASLLPRYRGASPIVQALLNLDESTGVCFMRMERGLDTGPIYRTLEYPLRGGEYADELEMKLGELAGRHVAETLCGIASGQYFPEAQDESRASNCFKIRKEDSWIDWRLNARRIAAMVRAYHPWPGARCVVRRGGEESVLTLRRVETASEAGLSPGEVGIPDRRSLLIGCGEGALRILEVTPAGSKPMDAAAFLNGLRGEKPEFLLRGDVPNA